MNGKNICWWAVPVLVFAVGCIPSLYPVFTEAQLVFDESLIGTWNQPKSGATWDFSRRDDQSYVLLHTEKERPGRFVARLAEIDGVRFLDLFPEEQSPDTNTLYRLHQVPIHTVYLVRRVEPTLELATFDFKWLNEYLADHPDALSYVEFNGQRLITAPTAELQKFLVEHQDKFTIHVNLERQPVEL